MDWIHILILLAMVSYAIYKQTRASLAGGPGRFKMALIYGAVGVVTIVIGGWHAPEPLGWVFLVGGILLSAIVGIARGVLTRVWVGADGAPLRQGTWLTISLFIALLAIKVASGIYAEWIGIDTGANFGEILVVVAVMIAVQSEIVSRRALVLTTSTQAMPA